MRNVNEYRNEKNLKSLIIQSIIYSNSFVLKS